MPPAEIVSEMRPKGILRPVFPQLAAAGGAYIIVSSTGSTTHSRLQDRRQAMRDALHDCPDAGRLHTDFFDRTRLLDWVRDHAGVVLWVREQVGHVLDGWRPYGPWSHPGEQMEASYIVDDRLRIHIGARGTPGVGVAEAMGRLRLLLKQPGKAVRLVGLSGVGKTRFVQALFDDRIGQHALATELAVYTDMAVDPNPQPINLATDLIAQGRRAVLVVDNCGSALHQDLAKVCAQANSKVSVITVEYDVREDVPEDTKVVTLDTASYALIEQLVLRRYPSLPQNAAQTIARASDGNARIALAIAGTVGNSENLTQLSNSALFERLLWQRHEKDKALLRAAQACALVYSFDAMREDGMPTMARRRSRLAPSSSVAIVVYGEHAAACSASARATARCPTSSEEYYATKQIR